MAKPITQETVDKAVEKAVGLADKAHRAAVKTLAKEVKEMIAARVADAKAVGNKDGARRLQDAGADIVVTIKELAA